MFSTPTAHHESCPDGSYKDSCNGCKLEGGVLTCVECSGPEGKNEQVTLTVGDCKDIGNVNGELKCEDKGAFANRQRDLWYSRQNLTLVR